MSTSISYAYRGLMAPVFTKFNVDDVVVLSKFVEDYACYLRRSGIGAVLVNGTTGEGPCQTVSERRDAAECWKRSCHTHDLSLMVQCGGGLPLPDVQQLAAHAQEIGADAVLLLPDLFFRPLTEEALVEYCARVAVFCAQTPLLYYHHPVQTGVTLNMPRFLELAEAAIPNFSGLKFTSNDLAIGAACLSPGRSVLLGADTILSGALALGFDSACMTSLNMWPQPAIDIMRAFRTPIKQVYPFSANKSSAASTVVDLRMAQAAQQDLNAKIATALQRSGDWVADMKAAMDDELERSHSDRESHPEFRLGLRVRRPRML